MAHEDFSREQEVKISSERGFGWVFTAVFTIAAVWPALFGSGIRWWSLVAAGVFMVATLAAPSVLAPLNRLWLRFGLLLHRAMSPLVLGFMFFMVVTPLAWIMRLTGKDTLRLRRKPGDASYWINRDPPGPKPESLRNQF
ncbi:MAG: hypothetical protein IT529_22580 [Burkholderiales bacterium]|nr:hypothetical protein [Burkholderiales bacterium]